MELEHEVTNPAATLIPPARPSPPGGRLERVSLDRIKRESRFVLRAKLRASSLRQLKESILEKGLLNPVHLLRDGPLFEITQGHRRVAAARLAGWREIEARVFDLLEEAEIYERAVDENLQREPLTLAEIALTCDLLSRVCKMKYADIAAKIGRGKKTVQRLLRIEKCESTELKRAFGSGQLPLTQALAILRIPLESQAALTSEFVEGRISSEDVRRRVREALRTARKDRASELADAFGPLPEFVTARRDGAAGRFVVELRARDRGDLLRL
ncbi:MAG: ParB/RepB/Spo0J family partition protein, partial [Planctomycetota bacterium]